MTRLKDREGNRLDPIRGKVHPNSLIGRALQAKDEETLVKIRAGTSEAREDEKALEEFFSRGASPDFQGSDSDHVEGWKDWNGNRVWRFRKDPWTETVRELNQESA